jgi:hypothetical protein
LHTVSHCTGALGKGDIYGLLEVSVYRDARSWEEKFRVRSWMKLAETRRVVKALANQVEISEQAAVSIENWHGNHKLVQRIR